MKGNNISKPEAGASASAALQCRTNPPQRILVVEDDAQIRRLNTEVLMESGFQVDAAEDGVAAWQALNTSRYDLMITDNNMPIVTGLELIKKLRSEDNMLPVILVSGTMPTEELAQHPWLQIQATLLKPYTIPELFQTVKAVLAACRPIRDLNVPPSNWQNLPSSGQLSV